MTRSTNMEHVEVLRHMKDTIKAIAPSEVAALDAAIAALSAPAEAQPCGCGEATCTVPWEPGCGLGKSEQHAEALQAENEALRDGLDYLRQMQGAPDVLELRAEVADLFGQLLACQHELDAAETRAERLAEALRLLPDDIDMVEHNPDEGTSYFCCGKAVAFGIHPSRWPEGSIQGRTHSADCWYIAARAALRDHDQEVGNG